MTAASALLTPDILLLILFLLDPATLASFRLTSVRINSIIIAHQKLICSSIALRVYSLTSLDFLPSYDSVPSSAGLGNIHIRALLRFPRARLLADRAFIKGNERPPASIGYYPKRSEVIARCTRGILIFWALVDIQQNINPDEATAPRYTPEPRLTVAPVTKRRGLVARQFRPRDQVTAPKSHFTSAAPLVTSGSVTPFLTASDGSPSGLGVKNNLGGPSASLFTRRFATVRAAQIPFVNLLSRPTRIDLKVAQGYLHSLMPSYQASHFAIASLSWNEQCWWKESWALRQGPAFMLAVSSTDKKMATWALNRMEQECRGRTREVLEVQRTTPIFLFPDAEMGRDGKRPLWEDAREVRGIYG